MKLKLKSNWRNTLPKSKLSRFKILKNRNKAFDKLSVREQMIEVCLDVLQQVISKKYRGTNHIDDVISRYVDNITLISLQNFVLGKDNRSEAGQEFLHNYGRTCAVCARGAMQLSTLRMGNHIDPTKSKFSKGNDESLFKPVFYIAMEIVYENSSISLDRFKIYHNTNEMLFAIYYNLITFLVKKSDSDINKIIKYSMYSDKKYEIQSELVSKEYLNKIIV